jgi:hypothetical protein
MLLQRVEEALGNSAAEDVRVLPERCLDAAIHLLEPLLGRDEMGRECALDLLAADALVTFAFEAAGAEPETLDARARDALVRLAALASDGDRVATGG